jgi:hypothetical protein
MDEAHDRHERADLVSAGLLAAATVASAWCAYQAALWSGDQLRGLADSNAAYYESLRLDSDANAAQLIDVGTFLNLVAAESRDDRKTADYIRTHARPEFRPALDAWLARREAGKDGERLPFDGPGYVLSARAKADEYRQQATVATQAANEANDHSDLFVLHTVLFATALFFLGSSASAQRRAIRRTMMAVGALVLILSVLSMVRLPRAPTAPGRGDLKAARHGQG